MDESLISIITPAYLAKPVITRAVASVLTQTYPHWELIVVSDDHTDYLQVLKEQGIRDERIRQVYTTRMQSGPAAARNLGLHHARGAYIAPLDADDLFRPDRLDVLLPSAAHFGAATDNMISIDDRNGEASCAIMPARDTWLNLEPRQFLLCNPSLPLLFRRDLVRHAWDEPLGFAEDVLFNLRIVLQLERVPVFAAPLYEHRMHPDSYGCNSGAAIRAERACGAILLELAARDLPGYDNLAMRQEIIAAVQRKRMLSQLYGQAFQSGNRLEMPRKPITPPPAVSRDRALHLS